LSTLAKFKEEKEIDADTESTGVVMHKDSRWSQNWQNFKDNNQYMHSECDSLPGGVLRARGTTPLPTECQTW